MTSRLNNRLLTYFACMVIVWCSGFWGGVIVTICGLRSSQQDLPFQSFWDFESSKDGEHHARPPSRHRFPLQSHSKTTTKTNSNADAASSITAVEANKPLPVDLPKNREMVTELLQKGTTLLPLGQTIPRCPGIYLGSQYFTSTALRLGWYDAGAMRMGNALSPYWGSRAMAILGGYEFEGSPPEDTWMAFLPTRAPAQPAEREIYEHTCSVCTDIPDAGVYFHKCYPGWLAIAKTIQQDTRKAIEKFAKTRPSFETDKVFKPFKRNDWLLYDRCCIGCHKIHAFANIRVHEHLPKDEEYTIHTLTPDSNIEDFGMCAELHERRNAYLQKLYPKVKIVEMRPEDVWIDFARLVFAPNVLVPSVGSSWILWSALLANTGRVLTPHPVYDVKFMGDDYPFTVLKDIPVMRYIRDVYPSQKWMAAGNSESKELILEWFMDGEVLP